MKFEQILQPGRLVARYKRFLADVAMDDGRMLTVHCPNSGSMTGCDMPGSRVLISCSDNPGRKYPHTLELVRIGETVTEHGVNNQTGIATEQAAWVGINTARTNALVAEAIRAGVVKELAGVETIRPEVRVSPQSRLDFLLSSGEEKIYLEVKNCTLAQGRAALFPDAVTIRGRKHLVELLHLRRSGCRAVVLFCVQREDVDYFSPAARIDPDYARSLREVASQGVEVLAYGADVSPGAITIVRELPVRFA